MNDSTANTAPPSAGRTGAQPESVLVLAQGIGNGVIKQWEIGFADIRKLAGFAIEAEQRAALAEAEKDEAYRQRNHLVAALARLFPSGTRRTNIEGWSDDWHGCCFIDLTTGQISYHYHDSHAYLFAALPAYETPWDGHDKAVVHARLIALGSAARSPADGKE